MNINLVDIYSILHMNLIFHSSSYDRLVGKTRSLIYIFMSSSRPFISVDKYEIEYSYVSDDAL